MQGSKKKNFKILTFLPVIEKYLFKPSWQISPPWFPFSRDLAIASTCLMDSLRPNIEFKNNMGFVSHAEASCPIFSQHYLPTFSVTQHDCSECSLQVSSYISGQCQKKKQTTQNSVAADQKGDDQHLSGVETTVSLFACLEAFLFFSIMA